MVTSIIMVTLPSIYDDAEKLRFIGILAYPKIILTFERSCVNV